MVKRNTELQLEAMKSFNGKDSVLKREEDDVKTAMRESLRSMESETQSNTEEQVALHASLREMELRHKQDEIEQLELEQALALSLAVEEERLQALMSAELAAEQEKEEDARDRALMEEKIPEKEDIAPKRSIVADAKNVSEENEFDVKGISSKDEPRDVTGSASAMARDMKQEADDYEKELLKKKKAPSKEKNESASSSFGSPKPLKIGSLGFKPLPDISKKPLGAIPSLSREIEELEDRKKKTQETFRRNKDMLDEQRAAEETMRKKLSEAETETSAVDESALRARHMKEQRERILAAKKRERQAKVQEEDARKSKGAEDELAQKAMEQAKKRMEKEKSAAGSPDAKGESDPVVERRRAAMRMALARRMKMDLVESEEQKFTKMQEDHFADLDKKLAQAEENRLESRRREMSERHAMMQKQREIAKNVQKSAAFLDGDD